MEDRESEALIHQAWRELTLAVSESAADHPWRTPVLVTGGGEAHGRVVVLRRFEPNPPVLECFTDIRSPKVASVRRDSWIHWIFYNRQLRLQARVRARAVIWHQDAAAWAAWDQLSPENRLEYAATTAPGSAWDGVVGLREDDARHHFAVIHSRPTEWDVLLLRRDGHLRVRWREGRVERLVP